MRILYLSNKDLNDETGVSKKILMQANDWINNGHDISLLSLRSLSFFSSAGDRISPALIDVSGSGIKTFYRILLSDLSLKRIIDIHNFDLLYFRYRPYSPFFIRHFNKIPRILEINSNDLKEYKYNSALLRWYNRLFRKKMINSVSALVFVSHELRDFYKSFDKPSIISANTIQTANVSFKSTTDTKRITFTFIGTPGLAWHGLDKVIFLAKKLPDYDFNVIGVMGENKMNLFYHGYLKDDEMQKILNHTDIGIGTLSLYLKMMHEASPLKTRQYLAHGIPMVYAYDDTDLNGQEEFCLKLPNNEQNVSGNIDLIIKFAEKVHHNSQIRKKARHFALTTLNVSVREKSKLKFFQEIYEQSRIYR